MLTPPPSGWTMDGRDHSRDKRSITITKGWAVMMADEVSVFQPVWTRIRWQLLFASYLPAGDPDRERLFAVVLQRREARCNARLLAHNDRRVRAVTED